jgi:tetratricopeptide (TPR) repeat protein
MKSLHGAKLQELSVLSFMLVLLAACPPSYTFSQTEPPEKTRPGVFGAERLKPDQKFNASASYNKLVLVQSDDVSKDGSADNIRRIERLVLEEQSSPLQLMLSKGAGKDARPGQSKKAASNTEDQAVTAQKNGDYTKAVELYKQDIASEPNNPKHHSNLAIVLELLNRYDEAISEYETVIKLNPKNSDAMVAIGDIYSISLGDDRSALLWYAKAIQTESDVKKKQAIAERIGKFILGEKTRRETSQ